MSVVFVEAQPEFPKVDLSDSNADLLELMLANAQIVQQGHEAAEKASWVYLVGHAAMRQAGLRTEAIESKLQAFDHGISMFETMNALVQSYPTHFDDFTVNVNAVALAKAMQPDKLLDYISAASERFGQDMQRASVVVSIGSKRLFRGEADYAIFGAALARQFQLDAA